MAANPFETLHLPPSATERHVLRRVRRPWQGATTSQLQAAGEQVRFSQEDRARYELGTFHAPDYPDWSPEGPSRNGESAELDPDVVEQLLGPLEAFVSKRTLHTLGAPLLDYLACNLAEALPDWRMPTTAADAVALAQDLAAQDPWLVHDLGLLCERHLQAMWDEEMMATLSRGRAKNLQEIAQLYMACLVRLAAESDFPDRLEAVAQGASPLEAREAWQTHLREEVASAEAMLGSAVDNDNADVLEAITAGWFGVLAAWGDAGGDVHAPVPSGIEAAATAELNRHREKVKASGVERAGVSGRHEDSLKVMMRLVVDRGVVDDRLMEVLLDACLAWLNEYINAEITEHADAAVEQTGRAARAVKASSASAKVKDDARIAQNRCMYVAMTRLEQAQKALMDGDEARCRELIDQTVHLTECTPPEAFVTLVDPNDGSKEETTATMIRAKAEELRGLVQVVDPRLEAVHASYRQAFAVFKGEDQAASIPMLRQLIKRLKAPELRAADAPIARYAGRTLLEEVHDTLNYALMHQAMRLLTEADGKSGQERRRAATEAVEALEDVQEDFALEPSEGMRLTRSAMLAHARSLAGASTDIDDIDGQSQGGELIAPLLLTYAEIRGNYDRDEYDTCLSRLEDLMSTLRGPRYVAADRPQAMFGGKTLAEEAQELADYAHMYAGLELVTGAMKTMVEGKGAAGTGPMADARRALEHLEAVPRGFSLQMGDGTMTRLEAVERAEMLLDAAETAPMREAMEGYMEALKEFVSGNSSGVAPRLRRVRPLLEAMRPEAYLIMDDDGAKRHVTCKALGMRVEALAAMASTGRPEPSMMALLISFKDCSTQPDWEKAREREKSDRTRRERAEAGSRGGHAGPASAAGASSGTRWSGRVSQGGSDRSGGGTVVSDPRPRRRGAASSALACVIYVVLLAAELYWMGVAWVSGLGSFASVPVSNVAVLSVLVGVVLLSQVVVMFRCRSLALQHKQGEVGARLATVWFSVAVADAVVILTSILVNLICQAVAGHPTALPYFIAFGLTGLSTTLNANGMFAKQLRS